MIPKGSRTMLRGLQRLLSGKSSSPSREKILVLILVLHEMDKRSYNSPLKSDLDSCKKLKISISPKISPRKKSDENNGNAVNLQEQIDIELEGLCFDDSEDDTFQRSEVNNFLPDHNKLSSKMICRCDWIFHRSDDVSSKK